MAEAGGVIPLRPSERQQGAADEHEDERGQREHAEYINPRGRVGRLLIRQELLGRQRGGCAGARSLSGHRCSSPSPSGRGREQGKHEDRRHQ